MLPYETNSFLKEHGVGSFSILGGSKSSEANFKTMGRGAGIAKYTFMHAYTNTCMHTCTCMHAA